jgi:hypothetical protein
MTQQHVNFSDPSLVCDTLVSAANKLLDCPTRRGCTHHLGATGTAWVSGDLHDNPFNLSKIINLASLDIPTNHVVFQEIIHSADTSEEHDLSYRMLVRVASLVLDYPTQVHPILANHELSQATKKQITKGGDELVGRFVRGVEHVFGTNSDKVLSAINTFIYAMPLAVRSSGGLMCCHSLPDENKMNTFDSRILARDLQPVDLMTSTGSANMVVWGRMHSEPQYNELAQFWGVTLFCLGHAWVPDGIEIAAPNVLLLNSDHENGVVLPIDLSHVCGAKQTISSAIKLSSVSLNQQ